MKQSNFCKHSRNEMEINRVDIGQVISSKTEICIVLLKFVISGFDYNWKK